MGDVKVFTRGRPAFRDKDRRQFVSQESCERLTNARMTVVRRAVIKENTDPDPNGNENISGSTISPAISEEPNVTFGVEGQEAAAEDHGEASNGPTNDTSKEESDVQEQIEEEEITPTREDDLSLSLEAFVPGSADQVDGAIAHLLKDLTLKTFDFVGNFTHRVEAKAKRLGKKQPSVEGPPENNIHLLHLRTHQVIQMGLHIKEHEKGCRISRIIKDSIACRTKLKENDIIMKINGFGLRCMSIGDIITHFSKIDITESFTLTIRRKIVTDNGKITFVDIDVNITITISAENEIDFEIDFEVTAQKLKYQSSTSNKYIAQVPTGRSPVYMRVDGKDACMDTKTDKQAVFRLELYRGGSNGRRVCVMRNQPSNQVIDRNNRNSVNELFATNAPSPNGQTVASPDTKYFYWDNHPNYKNDDVFESVNERGYYITSTDSNKLVLRKFNSLRSVTPEARFRIIDVK